MGSACLRFNQTHFSSYVHRKREPQKEDKDRRSHAGKSLKIVAFNINKQTIVFHPIHKQISPTNNKTKEITKVLRIYSLLHYNH